MTGRVMMISCNTLYTHVAVLAALFSPTAEVFRSAFGYGCGSSDAWTSFDRRPTQLVLRRRPPTNRLVKNWPNSLCFVAQDVCPHGLRRPAPGPPGFGAILGVSLGCSWHVDRVDGGRRNMKRLKDHKRSMSSLHQ